MNIQEFYKQYANVDIGDLSNNQKDLMYEALGSTLPEDLNGIEEHRMYVEILQKFRMANMKDMERMGAKFLDTLKSLLAVGEDGVYYMVAYKTLQESSAFRLWCKANGYHIDEYNEVAKDLEKRKARLQQAEKALDAKLQRMQQQLEMINAEEQSVKQMMQNAIQRMYG